MKKISKRNLQRMIDEKFITARPHQTLPIKVYNYTPSAQYDHVWNNETTKCRGLVMDEKYNVIARPFEKFYNLEELEDQGKQMPLEDFEIFEKMDGSLFLVFWYDNQIVANTRGSFESDQAIRGRKILQKYIEQYGKEVFNKAYTYCFEVIYPENRIVVSYGDIEDIFLLAVINTYSGTEMSYHDIQSMYGDKFKIAKRYDGITDYHEFVKEQKTNSEGYVIRFKKGLRVKVKFEEYKMLHRIVTGLSAKSIWEGLKEGKSLEEIYAVVPDELYKWINETVQLLKTQYRDIETIVLRDFAEVEAKKYTTRKEKAIDYQKYKYTGIMFMILDGKDYRDEIWKIIRPEYEKPFQPETEDI